MTYERSSLYLVLLCGPVLCHGSTLPSPQPSLSQHVSEYVFSSWYCLDLTWSNRSANDCLDDLSRAASEISDSISAKLSVSPSAFIISMPPISNSSLLSINLTLSQHNIPGLHHRLCNLQTEYPICRICGDDLDLVGVRHGRDQHLYIWNQEVISDCCREWQ